MFRTIRTELQNQKRFLQKVIDELSELTKPDVTDQQIEESATYKAHEEHEIDTYFFEWDDLKDELEKAQKKDELEKAQNGQ